MPPPMIEVAHFFSNFRSIGGVESMLREHHARDKEWGMNSRFIILNEAPQQTLERVHFLGMNRWTTIRSVHRQLLNLSLPESTVAIYHTLGPMRAFICACDLAARRLVFLHGKGDDLKHYLLPRQTWIDGVISVSEEARDLARQCLPHLPSEKLIVVPVPVAPVTSQGTHRPLDDRAIILGYSGRLLKQHKRVDRLPTLCGQLEKLGVDYRLEILGDGPERTWLEQQLAGNPRVEFLGLWSGEEYRQRIATWDVIVFVSDTEGQPVSLIEAMSGGAIPVFPRIGSGGDAYAEGVDPRLLYRAAATEQAAQIISQLSRATEEEISRLRSRSLLAVKPNLDGTYFAKIAGLCRDVLKTKRLSTDQFPWWPSPLNYVPLGPLSRLAGLRRRLLPRAGSARNART